MSSSQWEEKHLSSSGDGDQGETMNTQTSGTDSDASPQSSSSPHRATTIRSRMNTDKKSIERFHRHRGTNSRGDASSLPSPHTLAHETSPSVGPTYPTDSTLADKPAPDAPMDMDETERARLESMDETPMDESEAAPANPHPGDASVVTMSTASTKPNAFDIALGRSEDFQPSATLEEALGGPVWESAVADSQPTPVPAVATRTTPVVPPTDASVATMSTVSTKPNAFDVALARSGDVQGTDDTTEEATGGPVWESAVTSTIPTPVPEVARRSAQGRVAHQTTDISVATVSTASTKTNAFDIAFSRSADYQPPTETEDAAAGGPVWESAVSSSKPAPVPEVAKIASRFQPTDVSVATMSTVSTKPNAFDVALSRSEEAHEAANNEEETGGPVWESAVTSAKPTPVPEVAKMSSKVQTPSKPTDSSVASMSTVSTKPNAFDIALSRSTDFQSSSENKDDVAGGPVWESAVTSTKPTPVPEVAKMSSAKDKKSSPQVGGDEKQGGSVATASTHPNAFDVAVTRSADFNPSDNMDGVEGGRVWKKAVSSSKPPPVPMVARISHSRKDERSRPAWVRDTESCDGTASTLTGTNAFDTAMSMADIQTVQDSIKDEDGGPMWELAATSTEPEPLPMVAQTVPAVSVQASQPCEDSCDATRSTNTGTNAFDKALANSTDYSPMEYTDLDDEGGRMWGLAAPSTDSTPHGVAAMVRAIEANARTTPSDTTPEEIYDEPDSTPSDETSLSCEMSSTTPGASKFEKLRAPTPDACDVAPPKSEDMSEVFLDEEQLSTRQSSKKHDHKKKSHSKSKTTDAQIFSKQVADREDLAKKEKPMKLKSSLMQSRRQRMIQLVIIACLITIVGWVVNVLIGESCFLASITVELGQNNAEFDMHVGLWKYSPPDSILAGYSYCARYEDLHEENSPIVARIFHVSAFVAGSFSLGVLWYFLFTGILSPTTWAVASWIAFFAAICQALTLLFYVGQTCRESTCEWGLGSSLIPVCSFAWVVLGLEMRYQAPFLNMEENNAAKKDNQIELAPIISREDSASSAYKPPMFVA